jgi:hypothetical protein
MAGGSLVRKIATISAALYGVNILEVDTPGGVQGVASTAVGVLGAFPWGPEDTVTDCASGGEFFENFAPAPFAAYYNSYPALRAVLNKTFPGGLKVARISPSGAARGSKTFNDAAGTPAPSVVCTAAYKGAVGNRISVEWIAGSSGSKRSAIVRIDETYEVTYIDVVAATVVTDPGDPYVSFAAHASIALPPAVVAATVLTGGADGTPAAADYSGTAPAADGIRAFYPSDVDIAVMIIAEPDSALVDDANDALLAYWEATRKGIAVLCTVNGQTYSQAITYVADYHQNDGGVVYPWPKVNTINGFDVDRDEVEVDGASFVAAAIVSVDPEVSPGGAPGAPALVGISSLETSAEDLVYKQLNDAGISPFFNSRALGVIIRNGVTTSLISGKQKISRRRMTDFITMSIGEFLEPYVERPLDLSLSPPRMGPVTSAEYGAIEAFLADLKLLNRIESCSVDPYGGNTAAGIAAGTWVIRVAVKLFSSQDQIVLQAEIGQSVVVAEAA